MSASGYGAIKRERKNLGKFDPLAYTIGPVTVAPFNAEPSLTLSTSAVCLIDTAKMAARSKQEV